MRSVRWVDEELRKLLEGISARGFSDKTLVLVVTDHGGYGTGHGDEREQALKIWGSYTYPTKPSSGTLS